jgi:hypothetical protein
MKVNLDTINLFFYLFINFVMYMNQIVIWTLCFFLNNFYLCLGQAMLRLHLHNKLPGVDKDKHLKEALSWLEPCLSKLKGPHFSFLCGDAGPLALAAVIYHKLNDRLRSIEYIKKYFYFLHTIKLCLSHYILFLFHKVHT